MRSAIWMFMAVIGSVLALECCSNPVEPDSIWNLDREGEWIWFVKSNHVSIADTYHANHYAFVTLLDCRPFHMDTTRSVMFVSAVGDTEWIRPIGLHFSVPMIPEYNYGGASIFLSDLPFPVSNDGALNVGTEPSSVKAIYYHEWDRTEIQVTATVKP